MKLATGWAARTAHCLSLAAALACLAGMLTGCVYQRAEDAAAAQKSMIGASKAHVLDCMGKPDETLAYAESETLTYNSHPADTNARLFCKVDIVVSDGVVSRVDYNGATGGVFTRDEQCAPMVARCIAARPATASDKVIDFFKF